MRLFLLVFGLFLGLQSQATNIIVSDIDDTIKISHVLDKVESASNANKWENQFLGMAPLYRELVQTFTGAKVFYVSNAPAFLMQKNHELFLRYHGFPEGQLLLRQSLFDSSFKITTLRKLIKQYQPQEAVLIGDNGESDASIYNQIRQEFPAVKFYTYIHQPYSAKSSSEKGQPLQVEQKGFVTSVDLGKIWLAQGFITPVQFEKLIDQSIPAILAEQDGQSIGELAFPKWLDCRGHMIAYPLDLLSEYEQRLADRCAGR